MKVNETVAVSTSRILLVPYEASHVTTYHEVIYFNFLIAFVVYHSHNKHNYCFQSKASILETR
ncbi:hypothetical protein HYFRA_00011690 [Hymenoscyphus fraxineus]|uniref:Uncharacterized protein n=1 Tax=Hymenoscyphus fraxineus TaxID=746836 RepID=A0A9N9PQI4_9HELO|nr:hypothetical protein HYFRA_00011690 [Hymenoscyphus fraxineus]